MSINYTVKLTFACFKHGQASGKIIPPSAATQSATMQSKITAPSTFGTSSSSTFQQRPLSTSAAATATTSLPHGFFADKSADAKARGEKLPDNKDK
jgi:hypothetical protein